MAYKSLLPFWIYPFSWGLKGKSRKIAHAYYTLSGYELESTLLDIEKEDLSEKEYTRKLLYLKYKYKKIPDYDFKIEILNLEVDEKNSVEFRRQKLEIDYEFGVVSEKDYHRELINFIKDEKTAQLALAELEFREGTLSETDYQKRVATIKGEPWVTVLNMSFGGKNSLEGSFELDWNEPFVEKLKSEGYIGASPDLIVNQWFMEVCRNVAMEEFDGTGDFAADSQANLETVKRWSNELPTGRKGYM
jgi:hypothetical protein